MTVNFYGLIILCSFSIRRLLKYLLYFLLLLIPGHGNCATDKKEMKKRQSDSLTYLYSMRKLIKENDQSAIDHLIDGYKFPSIMKDFHRKNQLLLKKKMGQDN